MEACLPFAEQKVVSGVVFSSDAPVLFQSSLIMDGSRNEGPELLLSCHVTQTAAYSHIQPGPSGFVAIVFVCFFNLPPRMSARVTTGGHRRVPNQAEERSVAEKTQGDTLLTL